MPEADGGKAVAEFERILCTQNVTEFVRIPGLNVAEFVRILGVGRAPEF